VAALLAHDPVRHLDRARAIRGSLPAGYPTDDDVALGMCPAYDGLLADIESAEREGAEVMASRARVAAIRAKIDAEPGAPLAPLLAGLASDEHTALTPALCRHLGAVGGADGGAARETLHALGERPAATRTFFHAIEPWLTCPDHELRGLSLRAALASRSRQARARFVSRLREACADDASDACTILKAFAAESQLLRDVVVIARSSPIPEVRATLASLLAEEEARLSGEDEAETPRPPTA
jgi:hypothetical protein